VIAGRYLGLVKFEHTLFAMPFALMSLLVATQGWPSLHTLLWVVVAMVGARSAAMAFNRLVDRHFDARNPRTSARHIPMGEVSPRGAAGFTLLAAAVLVFAASRLNTLCFALSPVALLVVLGYSYTKRLTRWAHLVLGLGLAVAPVGAWLAATGSFAAFPLSCQDIEFDRREELHSVPATFGVRGALRTARVLHVLSVACLAMALTSTSVLGPVSLAGVVVMAILLIQEHRLVRDDDLSRIDKAFFVINSWIGAAVLGCVLIDLYLV